MTFQPGTHVRFTDKVGQKHKPDREADVTAWLADENNWISPDTVGTVLGIGPEVDMIYEDEGITRRVRNYFVLLDDGRQVLTPGSSLTPAAPFAPEATS